MTERSIFAEISDFWLLPHPRREELPEKRFCGVLTGYNSETALPKATRPQPRKGARGGDGDKLSLRVA